MWVWKQNFRITQWVQACKVYIHLWKECQYISYLTSLLTSTAEIVLLFFIYLFFLFRHHSSASCLHFAWFHFLHTLHAIISLPLYGSLHEQMHLNSLGGCHLLQFCSVASYLICSSRIPLQLHSYYQKIVELILLRILHVEVLVSIQRPALVAWRHALHTVDQKYAVTVECWTRRCYCELLTNVVYDNLQWSLGAIRCSREYKKFFKSISIHMSLLPLWQYLMFFTSWQILQKILFHQQNH